MTIIPSQKKQLVDALPYIDVHGGGTFDIDAQVKHLIGKEMTTFEPEDYLAEFPAPKLEHLSSGLLKAEMERIDKELPMEKISLKRYDLEPPSGASAGDLAAWKAAVKNAKTQQAHFQLQTMNVELLTQWGVQMHVQNKIITQKMEEENDKDIVEYKEKIDSVNKKRKLEQMSWGNDLRNLQQEYERRSRENGDALLGVQHLKNEIRDLKRLCVDRAVLPEDWFESLDSDAQRLLLPPKNEDDDVEML